MIIRSYYFKNNELKKPVEEAILKINIKLF